jgi:hypothetical protein
VASAYKPDLTGFTSPAFRFYEPAILNFEIFKLKIVNKQCPVSDRMFVESSTRAHRADKKEKPTECEVRT